ncbi:hypothetical protein ZIOFF_067079 [Zingiber officinale]|uniref:L-asparaginase n=1 Tax=Zingiber officinale TaxID=94328 RepID=A0A8J5C5C5_ZINOF|nr:hypothetical protein ZIOFF_067079 [Zingiber officinale]
MHKTTAPAFALSDKEVVGQRRSALGCAKRGSSGELLFLIGVDGRETKSQESPTSCRGDIESAAGHDNVGCRIWTRFGWIRAGNESADGLPSRSARASVTCDLSRNFGARFPRTSPALPSTHLFSPFASALYKYNATARVLSNNHDSRADPFTTAAAAAKRSEGKMVGWAIAVHGGAGVDPSLPAERQEAARRVLSRCLALGASALRAGRAAVDVVEMVVRDLETDPVFNSGRGSALTRDGTVEMEASIMDGRGRRCGAVSGLTTVKNPVSLARLVMDRSPHSYLAFDGAEEFARQQVLLSLLLLPCFIQ